MYSKFNIKLLAIIFGILLILVLVVYVRDSKKGERSFRSEIVETDTSKITSITIYPQSDKEKKIELVKNGATWRVKSDDKVFSADKGVINNILATLNDMKPKRVVATQKDRWKEFDVTDSTATRVKLFTDKKQREELYIGKFNYQQPKNPSPYNYNQRGTMSTYIRLADEKIVYSVEGFLGMTFNREVNDFRNKTIIRSNRNDFTRLSFTYPGDSSFNLIKENSKWMIDGLLADSASVASYLNSISYLSSSDFVDDQKPEKSNADFTLRIEGNNFIAPVQIKAFATDTTHNYLINSSLNSDAYFSDAKSNLVKKIFVGKNNFFKQTDQQK